MADYAAMIRQTEVRIRELKAVVAETHKTRDVSASRREEWLRACAALNTYQSPIDGLLEACEAQGISDFADLRSFAFAYVEVDPYFHRSGYVMEGLLRQIKRLDFSESEKAILRNAVLKRITRGARREFKHLCRTLPKINTERFEATLQDLAKADQKAIRDRAKIALAYL